MMSFLAYIIFFFTFAILVDITVGDNRLKKLEWKVEKLELKNDITEKEIKNIIQALEGLEFNPSSISRQDNKDSLSTAGQSLLQEDMDMDNKNREELNKFSEEINELKLELSGLARAFLIEKEIGKINRKKLEDIISENKMLKELFEKERNTTFENFEELKSKIIEEKFESERNNTQENMNELKRDILKEVSEIERNKTIEKMKLSHNAKISRLSDKWNCDDSRHGQFGNFDHDDDNNDNATRVDGRFESCLELLQHGSNESGVYMVYPAGGSASVVVYCDQVSDGGGWTVFQRRQDGNTNFDRSWDEYKCGFGDRNREFWLGNDNLHLLTVTDDLVLRIDLGDWTNDQAYATYDRFRIGPENEDFSIHFESNYSGNAGDALTYHNGMPFSTKDRDNDMHTQTHCAQKFSGGWWFNSCLFSGLNGVYTRGGNASYPAQGVYWYHWKGYNNSLKYSEMKFRKNNKSGDSVL